MILYASNPRLKLRVIETINGDKEYRTNCKYIGGKYYRIDRDCFCIDGRWYRVDGGNIIFDFEEKRWVHKTKMGNMIKGVVGYASGAPVFGHFTPNPFNNIKVRFKNEGTFIAYSADVFRDMKFIEDVAVGIIYPKNELSSTNIKRLQTIRNEKSHTSRGYNIEDNVDDFKTKVTNYNNSPIVISKNAYQYAKFLGNITFGAEIEIAQGNIPEHIQHRHGLVICRDGSIDGGPELVTIPLTGAKGLQNLDCISKELQDRGSISLACSLHLHIGNIRMDKSFLTAVYVLGRKIQDELFTMFPFYKTDHRGIKRKNYNKKLDSLSIHPCLDSSKESMDAYLADSTAKIFDFLAEGKMHISELNKKTRQHPEQRKWEQNSRYYWLNMMNIFFTHRNTVEFRLHTPTTNSAKMINWLFICNAIIKYADLNTEHILTTPKKKISIKEVFDVYSTAYPDDKNAAFLSKYLYEYFLQRQDDFKKDLEKDDKISEWDITQDKDFTFEYKKVKSLV